MSFAPIFFNEDILQKYPQFWVYLRNLRSAVVGSFLPISGTIPYKNKSGENLGTAAFRWLNLPSVNSTRQIYVNTANEALTKIPFTGDYNSAYVCLSGQFTTTQSGLISFRFYDATVRKINYILINRYIVGSSYGGYGVISANVVLTNGLLSTIQLNALTNINSAPITYRYYPATFSMIIPANFAS